MVFGPIRRALKSRLQTAAAHGEDLLERLAVAEVDAAIHAGLRDLLMPIVILATLLLGAQIAGNWIGEPEARRLATTSIVLCAWFYGFWTLAHGLLAARPLMAVWAATRQGPHNLARLLLYQRIITRLRSTFTTAEGEATRMGKLTLQALRLIDAPETWEAVAFRLANRLAPRLIRHAAARTLTVVGPVLGAWVYYRFIVFPELVRAGSGLGPWEALLYPVAALVDLLGGTHLRDALRA